MWLQLAPVDDRIVVSEIGEHWSPNRPDEITSDDVCFRNGILPP